MFTVTTVWNFFSFSEDSVIIVITWRFVECIRKVRSSYVKPEASTSEPVGARGALSADLERMECWTCRSRSHEDTECPNILRNDQGAREL